MRITAKYLIMLSLCIAKEFEKTLFLFCCFDFQSISFHNFTAINFENGFNQLPLTFLRNLLAFNHVQCEMHFNRKMFCFIGISMQSTHCFLFNHFRSTFLRGCLDVRFIWLVLVVNAYEIRCSNSLLSLFIEVFEN